MEKLNQPPEMDFNSHHLAETWRRWKQTMQFYLDVALADKEDKEKFIHYWSGW
jgi:hypothetical protein